MKKMIFSLVMGLVLLGSNLVPQQPPVVPQNPPVPKLITLDDHGVGG
ncbi:hypothetical protein NLX71_24370 [Paenibacillus sp. MZ04-78.2]|nr:hypothetical protein [Paenibacillus sp. MZ04-78.2]MCP3776396.1 hypothetical protein [Paenibacillus sp. MZ04-78.2]